MNLGDSNEIWQIEVSGQIYEANFEVMTQWIHEGALMPEDLVKRGNLRWIEARKVPALTPFFNAKQNGMPPPPVFTTTSVPAEQPSEPTFATLDQSPVNPYQTNVVSTTDASLPPTAIVPTTEPVFADLGSFTGAAQTSSNDPIHTNATFNQAPPTGAVADPNVCAMHPETASAFICTTCGSGFCRTCPKSYGGNVKICPFCGDMCRPVQEVAQKMRSAAQYDAAISGGFGFDDFMNALAYPFRFKSSLIIGSIMYMLFTLGQNASAFGGFALVAAGLLCGMFSNMLTFGVLMNTVENFAQGKVGSNFMPEFDDFSLWDDVVHPFFLMIGTYLASFGLFFLFVGGLAWYAWSTVASKAEVNLEDRIRAAQKEREDARRGGPAPVDDPSRNYPTAEDDQRDIEDIQKMIQEGRKKELESVTGKTTQQKEEDMRQMVMNFIKFGIPAVGVALLLLLWGIFYYPAACLVAGYTKSFAATLKLSVGWETIRILGWDYVKILLMCLLISIALFFVGLIIGIILSPFDMPAVGNLPAKAIGSFFGFYFSVVYALVLGFALYKNADKLNLYRN